ncbi:MAG: cytochrome c [Gammaproteobacteria bacterium]|nr:cytochrome c [Gammaproteobacteria bacterium]
MKETKWYSMTKVRGIAAASMLLWMASCAPPERAPGQEPGINVPFVPDISINEIMVGQVDHAAHEILRLSLADNQRLTIGAWQELEHNAIQLISSTSAITMGGSGVNDAMWVAQSGWREFTLLMNEAASSALQATRSQDLPALMGAADSLRASCDGCHLQYKPEIPTEGFYRLH